MLAKGCDCLLLLTEWDEFAKLDFNKIKNAMRQAIIFDGRNFYSDIDIERYGFEYHGLGRGDV